jgi:hypothetical protein
MSQRFQAGDFLVYQLESGYALLKVLEVTGEADPIWHLAAYDDFFFEVEEAEKAILSGSLRASTPHLALTNRAFEGTQVAKLVNVPLSDEELEVLDGWNGEPSDKSIRLLLGYR